MMESSDMYFYHSFPKNGDYEAKVKNGLEILKSIVKNGFLLPSEDLDWAKNIGISSGNLPTMKQKRICFTFIKPDELFEHMSIWGPYSIEFDEVLMELGAMPVLNVPTTHDGRGIPSHLMVKNLFDSLNFLKRYGHIKTGINGVRAIFGLLYPAEDKPSDPRLKNYRLREWRITGNTLQIIANKQNFKYRLNSDDISELKSFLPENDFKCAFQFKNYNSRKVMSYANRVIVPDEVVKEARLIIDNGMKGEKLNVISYQDFREYYNLK